MENIGFKGAQYGLMLDQINDYGARGEICTAARWLLLLSPCLVNGGLTPLIIEHYLRRRVASRPTDRLISGAYFLTPSSTKWAIISPGWLHIDSASIDSENGGTYTVVEVPNMLQPTGPWLSVTIAR